MTEPPPTYTPTLADAWLEQLRNLAHATAERVPIAYVADGLLETPCLAIVYGAPGSLKSMLLADLAVCVAGGKPWLSGLPGGNIPGIPTTPAPVLWLDFDNGQRRSDERFAALAKAHEVAKARWPT